MVFMAREGLYVFLRIVFSHFRCASQLNLLEDRTPDVSTDFLHSNCAASFCTTAGISVFLSYVQKQTNLKLLRKLYACRAAGGDAANIISHWRPSAHPIRRDYQRRIACLLIINLRMQCSGAKVCWPDGRPARKVVYVARYEEPLGTLLCNSRPQRVPC